MQLGQRNTCEHPPPDGSQSHVSVPLSRFLTPSCLPDTIQSGYWRMPDSQALLRICSGDSYYQCMSWQGSYLGIMHSQKDREGRCSFQGTMLLGNRERPNKIGWWSMRKDNGDLKRVCFFSPLHCCPPPPIAIMLSDNQVLGEEWYGTRKDLICGHGIGGMLLCETYGTQCVTLWPTLPSKDLPATGETVRVPACLLLTPRAGY